MRNLLDAERLREVGREMQAMQQDLRREDAPREAVAEQTAAAAPLGAASV